MRSRRNMLSKITVFGDELRRMNSRFQSTTSELNACSTRKPNTFIARIGASKPEQSVPIVIIWSGRGDGNPCFAACSRQFFMATGAHELITAVIDAGMRSFCPCGVARGFVLHGPTASSSDRLIEPVAEELRACGIARWPCVARRLRFGGGSVGPTYVRRTGHGILARRWLRGRVSSQDWHRCNKHS